MEKMSLCHQNIVKGNVVRPILLPFINCFFLLSAYASVFWKFSVCKGLKAMCKMY